ncbi:MAG: DUF4129 domain-containing protein [Actinomycetia bacterium]|nr:DUF4129 domain-containing protein [Actinomycetes bacterium]
MIELNLRLDIPVDIGRDEAQQLAERELLNPLYSDAQPPWWQRTGSWVWEHFTDLLNRLGGAASNLLWLIVVAAVIALIVFVIVRRAGGVQRRRARGGEVFTDRTSSAADHRARAEGAARMGDWNEAVLEGFRVIVRQLEERGALDPRAGRTADEAARDAGAVFGPLRSELDAAARAFDEVAYGDRPGTAEAYAQITSLDCALKRSVMASV